MSNHKMGLSPSQMLLVREGIKTIELRLYDEKRRKLREGDTIVFVNTENKYDVVQVRIYRLHIYDSFQSLYRILGTSKLGYTQEDIDTASYKDMYKYYSEADIQKYGVVGIEVDTKTWEGSLDQKPLTQRYIWLNKDTDIGLIEVDLNKDKVELLAQYEDTNFIGDVESYIKYRTFPVNRKDTLDLCKQLGIVTIADYLDKTHGISLTDTFWFKPITSDLTWNSVNPYKMHTENLNLASLSLDGSTSKSWHRIHDIDHIFKTSGEMWSGPNGKNGIRPFCEYYSNQVVQRLVDNFKNRVTYSIHIEEDSNGTITPYAVCSKFTDENTSLIPYKHSKYKDTPVEELCDKYQEIRKMLLVDSIILNCDRHPGNYGFLVDNNTLEIKGFAPIYDQDCSLGFNISILNKTYQEVYDEAIEYKLQTNFEDYLEQAEWVLTGDLKGKLKSMYPFHFKRLDNKSKDISDDRIASMEFIVNTQIEKILNSI